MQAMQAIIDEAAEAIRSIRGTIGRVDDIAVAIAVAVEEQNAATAEIARNVQEAVAGTRNVTGRIDALMYETSRLGYAVRQMMTAALALCAQAATIRQQGQQLYTACPPG